MNKRSVVHPTLKTAIGSLELEIETEISRYQQNCGTNSLQKHHSSNKPEVWENPVISVETTPEPKLISVFKQPWGMASVLITMIASGLLGASLYKPVQTQQDYSTPIVVEGLNLAQEELELNLQSISTLKNPHSKQVNQLPKLPNSKTPPHQSQLETQLLPKKALE